MRITLVAGARPNFMKIAPIIDAVKKAAQNGSNVSYRLVHTGQHYDKNMSNSFFEELGIPEPDVNLECGGGTQAEQTANIMVKFEKDLMQNPVDLVLVVGDVTSTLACSIVAKKLNIRVAHVEAGIRSGDVAMPEEINRMVTDSITDYFFTTSQVANENLRKSGVEDKRIFFVGNTMIDSLLKNMHRLKEPAIYKQLALAAGEYFVVTLHRPSNVDNPDNLKVLINTIMQGSKGLPVLFPVHPRTAQKLKNIDIQFPNLHTADPMSYLEFNYLVKNSKAVITDSGGITEETTMMGIPCLTLRNSTERPETVTVGTNELIGTDPAAITPAIRKIFDGKWKKGSAPEMWDGKTAERIVSILEKL
ncbi:MAG: UDP-N-acetylglucosamine 2-epimerase (non-hydrolyzing) [Chitinophagaceae bacterium]|nr:UDP-N-acetylglucosamine 2-epimerase (non-hydrolyzing) [Chitinophagaceae bacterium]